MTRRQWKEGTFDIFLFPTKGSLNVARYPRQPDSPHVCQWCLFALSVSQKQKTYFSVEGSGGEGRVIVVVVVDVLE